MTKLSVNINKVAIIRNARGGNTPNLLQIAQDCEKFGAQGITVHPRPDQRHIRYDDIAPLKAIVTTEFNIEGNPEQTFIDLVLANKPHQCTLVPDAPDQLTSDSGWDTIKHHSFLKEIIAEMQKSGIRVSLFVDPIEEMIHGAQEVGADRIELYTGEFAKNFHKNKSKYVNPHTLSAQLAHRLGLGINAGHDLNLDNLKYYKKNTPNLAEVSIGHALISDALYFGLEKTIKKYLSQLK
jgi:pyridoxine 5-phosphate synthase